jgi:hypothetical protein
MRLLVLVLALSGPMQDNRLPVPEAAAQKEAEKLLRDVFKEEYARKAPADRAALSRTMLQRGLEKDEEAASRHALLREAKELAIQAGDWDLALKATDSYILAFEGDGVQLKEATLAAWAKVVGPFAETVKLARAYLAFAEEAGKSGRFDAAERAAAQASSLAKKVKDVALAAKAETLGKDLADRRGQGEKLAAARRTLETKPADPEANLLVGRQECLVEGNWDLGLPKLAQGSDPTLKALARRDLLSPAGAGECAAVGDGWWDLAEQQTGPVRLRVRERARSWYERALPGLAGLTKAKVTQRLGELGMDRFPGVWVDVTDGKRFGRTERPGEAITLVPDEGKDRLSLFQEFPPGTFDAVTLRMRFPAEWTGKGMIDLDERTKCLVVHRTNRVVALCTKPKTDEIRWKVQKQIECPEGQDFVVTVVLCNGAYEFFLNGNAVGSLPTTIRTIGEFDLLAGGVPVAFDQIKLRRKE